MLEMLLHLLPGSAYRSTRKSKAYIFRIRCNVDVEWGWQWSWGCNGAIERSEPTPIKLFTSFPLIAWDKCKIKKQTLRAISPQNFHVVISNKQTKNPVKLFTSFALIARKQMQTNTVRINTNTDHFLCRPLIHICNTYIYIKYIMYYISCIKTSQCKKANKHSVPAP